MSATKDALFDCLASGVVPVPLGLVTDLAARLGDNASLLKGMPMAHSFENRWGELVDIPVIPVAVARRIGEILPDTHDSLGWLLELAGEGS